jgi:7-keto-8-aminopelargonate synthetase-like enzyme
VSYLLAKVYGELTAHLPPLDALEVVTQVLRHIVAATAVRACVHVRLELARLREALAAALVVAGIWSLARVRALVPREVARLREALAAALVLADVRLVARVRAIVRREVARLREALATALVLADVRLVARVRALVRR